MACPCLRCIGGRVCCLARREERREPYRPSLHLGDGNVPDPPLRIRLRHDGRFARLRTDALPPLGQLTELAGSRTDRRLSQPATELSRQIRRGAACACCPAARPIRPVPPLHARAAAWRTDRLVLVSQERQAA